MGILQWYLEYDFTERLLYGAAALFTAWFIVALILRKDKAHWIRDWSEAGFTAVWLALGIRMLLLEAYAIPSESMVPALLVRDHLLVSKLSFGWHVPFTKGRVMQFSSPQRGEIVIFVPPHQPKQSFVKRCVGLPGDLVEVRDKHVFINGRDAENDRSYGRLAAPAPGAVPALRVEAQALIKRRQALGSEDLRRATEWKGPIQTVSGSYFLEGNAYQVVAYARLTDTPLAGVVESLPKGFEAPDMQAFRQQTGDWSKGAKLGNRDWFGPYQLGPGQYWMMGDNRDNSSDSRYFGPVPTENLRGRPMLRYWPIDRMGLVD